MKLCCSIYLSRIVKEHVGVLPGLGGGHADPEPENEIVFYFFEHILDIFNNI